MKTFSIYCKHTKHIGNVNNGGTMKNLLIVQIHRNLKLGRMYYLATPRGIAAD
jgi:hypothetical protein